MRNLEYSWYLLTNAPGFGAKSIHYLYENLLNNKLSVNDLFDLTDSDLMKYFPEIGRGRFSGSSLSTIPTLERNDRLYHFFEKLKSEGVTIIGLSDERYPEAVLNKMGSEAPPILYCRGYLSLLNDKGVSIVGARDVGEFEVSVAKSIAQKLAESGINVTSGYAKGVDSAAHLGALEADGTTTMILSFGTNHISIKSEFKEFNWEKNSLFVSQFAPYEKFSGQNAMARNKLVCAMSRALVVIKSGPERDNIGKMSGTFDAGKTALKMGIPVYVLSPKLLQPIPQGNIDLIKQGGIEFTNGSELLEFIENLRLNDNIVEIKKSEQLLPKKRTTGKDEKGSYQYSLFE